ncbi:MAG: MFS transporter [Spirochaetes bacterium]|nr:MFS transporter [Spirochaetota bacterium]
MPDARPRFLNAHSYSGLALFAATVSAFLSATQRIGGEYGVDTRGLGFLLGGYFLSFFVSSVTGGLIAGRLGMKAVLFSGYAVTAFGLLLFATGSGVPFLAAAVIAVGLGGGILEGMTTSVLLVANPGRSRAVIAQSQLFYCLGALGGTALIGFIFSSGIPWRTAFGALLVPAAVLGILLLAIPLRADGGVESASPRRAPLGRLLSFSALLFLFVYVETGLTSWIPFLLGTDFKLAEPRPQWIFAGFWAAFLVSRLIISFARIPVSARVIAPAAFLLLLSPLAALCFPLPLPALIVSVVACGLFASPLWILIVTWADEHMAPAQASLVVGAGGLAAGTSPFLSAPLIAYGGARLHFAVLFGVTVLALAGAVWMARLWVEGKRG